MYICVWVGVGRGGGNICKGRYLSKEKAEDVGEKYAENRKTRAVEGKKDHKRKGPLRYDPPPQHL